MKHERTPGPWRAVHDDFRIYPKWIVLAHEGNPNKHRNVLSDIGAADAHLIAAAPDLLDVCEHAIQVLGQYSPLRQMAEAAVAKAKGRDQ